MRILFVHNYYGSSFPSGENHAFEIELALLQRRGHTVATHLQYSDKILSRGVPGMVYGGLVTPWNQSAATAFRRAVRSFRPDVVHVHNTFPLLSPAIFHAVGDAAPTILTLHNYRLLCPGALMLREGRVCTECLNGSSTFPAIRHGCYRGSRVATLPLALSVSLHKTIGTWRRRVDAFIALSDFQRELMASGGLPRDRVFVNPNFIPGNPTVVPWEEREKHIVFVGRLTREKGVASLVEAWLAWGEHAPELHIVGDGPLRKEMEERAGERKKTNIRFLGRLSPEDTQREIGTARMLVLPSVWFETFGLVIGEAFAHGTPAAVSNIGPLPSVVGHGTSGLVFSVDDPRSLLETVRSTWEAPGILERLSRGARAAFERCYTEEMHYQKLMGIYEAAIARKGARLNDLT